jgi:hypothetical protein
MNKHSQLYQRLVPVSKDRHAKVSIDASQGYGFAREFTTAPIVVLEFSAVAREFPIVFMETGETLTPMAILGFPPGENLFVDEEGKWKGRYVPAFFRRYPFVFAKTDKADQFLLYVDEDYAGLNDEKRGTALFSENGDNSPFLNEALEFLKHFTASALQTEKFCKTLKDLNILSPLKIAVSGPDKKKYSIRGALAVDRTKLKNINGFKLKELAKDDTLELIYLHLNSLKNFDNLGRVQRPAQASRQAEAATLM